MTPLLRTALCCVMATTAWSDDHDPLQFEVEGSLIYAEGEIDTNTPALFETIARQNPGARTLVLDYIGGSVDDHANLEFSRRVRGLGFTTVVPSHGLVASGGTDLFLAGVEREVEEGACIGVHSWAAEDFTATDLPRTDPEHRRYLRYYDAMGIASDFYWFTIAAAPADGMHWMTMGEVRRFGMTTAPVPQLGTGRDCDQR